MQAPHWPSPPGTFHILIGKFSYFVIRFLLNSSIVKSDNEIGKVNEKRNLITKQENSEIGKKVITDGLDLGMHLHISTSC